MTKKYKVIFGGEMEDDVFDTYEKAEEYACYMQSCEKLGNEMLELSNPGDYPMELAEESEYEIIEVDE